MISRPETVTIGKTLAASLAMAIVFFVATTGPAYAGGMKDAIDTVLRYAEGFRQPLGIIAVVGLGIAVVSGRASWPQALIIAAGIAIAVHYPAIVSALSGSPDSVMTEIEGAAKSIGPPIAIIAIIALGIGAMFGRITWSQAMFVAAGVVILANPGNIYTSVSR